MHAWKRPGCDGTGVLIAATTTTERDLAERGVGLAPHPHPTPPLPQQPGHVSRRAAAERRAEALVAPHVGGEGGLHGGVLGVRGLPRLDAIIAERGVERGPRGREPLGQRVKPRGPAEVEEARSRS